MKLSINRLWIAALLLGWFADFLFWKKPGGINFAIFVVLCLGTGFYLLVAGGIRPSWRSLLLLLPILFLAVMTFLRLEELTIFLSVAMTLFLMALLVITYLDGRWLSFGVADAVVGFFRLAGSLLIRPITYGLDARRETPPDGTKTASRVWPVLRGLLIALPVVVVFAALLASADLVFARWLDDFTKLFRLERLPEYILRGILIALAAYLLAGTFLHAAFHSRSEPVIGESKSVIPPFLGFIEASIVLGSVIALFASFVVIQFQYFFGGQGNIHIEGYTYSEYARRGFGELVAVAFFSLLLLLGLSSITRRENDPQRRTFSGLGIGMVALVLVILVSAFQRLMLYENAYGFTRLRTYPHVFMIWLGLLLVAVIVLEALRRERAFAMAFLLAAFGFIATLGLLDVDAFIVRQNVQRAIVSGELDSGYLAELSDDAVPAMAQFYRDQSLPVRTRESVGAALACYAHQRNPDKNPFPWQGFHLSRYRADQALDGLQDDLGEYEFQSTDWPWSVTLPSGEEFPCESSSSSD